MRENFRYTYSPERDTCEPTCPSVNSKTQGTVQFYLVVRGRQVTYPKPHTSKPEAAPTSDLCTQAPGVPAGGRGATASVGPVSGATSLLLQLLTPACVTCLCPPPGSGVHRDALSRSGERTQVGSRWLVRGWLSISPPFCDGSKPSSTPRVPGSSLTHSRGPQAPGQSPVNCWPQTPVQLRTPLQSVSLL